MAYTDNFPQRPVFMADFSNGGRIDPRATFSRASTGTFFGTDKVLSSENLLTYSNPNNAAWNESNGATVSTNAAPAPNGTTTASSIVEDSANSQHRTFASINATSGQVYTLVAYLKANGRTIAQVATSGAVSSNVEFDLSSSGTATTRSGSPANSSISQIGSTGWYKCSFQVTAGSTATLYLNVYLCDSANSNSYTGDGTSGVYAWGCNVSTTGQLVHEDTSGQIARSYQTKLQTAASGVARFEHSATDGQSMGILIEGQSTNLYGNSLDMTGVAGTRTIIDPNVAVGPTGELTADALRLNDTDSSTHYREYSFTASASTTYTFSVYLKAAGLSHAAIRSNNLFSTEYVYFNLSNGTVEGSPAMSNSMTSVGNGWYRCSVTATTTGSGAASFVIYITDSASSTVVATGDSYRAILGQAIQIESGSYPSSFIETSGGSTATRALESLSMTDSSLFDNGGGALFVEASSSDKSAAYSGIASINDGSSNNRVEVYNYYTYVRGDVGADGATQSSQYGGAFSSDVAYKACLTYDSNNVSLYANGSEIGATDTAASMPKVDRITLGNTNSGTNYLNGHIKRVAVFSEPVSETNAAALTS